jgi:hypothetical protein
MKCPNPSFQLPIVTANYMEDRWVGPSADVMQPKDVGLDAVEIKKNYRALPAANVWATVHITCNEPRR